MKNKIGTQIGWFGFWVVAFLSPITGHTTISLEGYFIAQDNCPALHSIRKGTNPGNITLSKGIAYEVIGKNKPDETHYLVKIEAKESLQRWVAVSCGKLLIDCQQKTVTDNSTKPEKNATDDSTQSAVSSDYLLAISWQPAFCQTHQQKPECASQTVDRYDATHLSLHGLWPQPESRAYCKVSNQDKTADKQSRWHLLPAVELTEPTLEKLTIAMPGVASHLERHEWIKHGTCYGDSAEVYYQHALALLEQLNDSSVRNFIEENVGKTVTAAAIRAQFDESFGKGTGGKVNIKCNQGMITELWINLTGQIGNTTPLSELLKNAESVKASCEHGIIDPVGF